METTPHIYQFCQFELDPNSATLSHNGRPVDVPEKSFLLLEKLLAADKRVVEKYHLLDELWQGLVVSEWSLSRLISDTRHLLAEFEPEQEIIQTLRGKGFRIHPNVQVILVEAKPPPSPVILPQPEPTSDTHGAVKTQTRLAWWYALMAIVLIAAAATYWQLTKLSPTASPIERSELLTILPVKVSTKDDQDRWVEYGVMTMVIEELQRFPQINVANMSSTVNNLSNITFDYADEQIFQQVCPALGCKQLLLMTLTLSDENEPSLNYQLLSHDRKSEIYSFINQDILEASNMMLEHLIQKLLPHNPERLSLSHTYTEDPIANQDYAIGVSRLYHGEYQDAKDYLNLALKRAPTFTWAELFLAEVLYREGKLLKANQKANALMEVALEIRQSIFLQNLLSNIAYSQGNLALSVEIAQAFLPAVEQTQDQDLYGSTHMNIGTSYQALGDIDNGLAHLTIALDTFQTHGFKLREAQALLNLGNTIWVGKSEYEAASQYYQQAADLFRQLGSQNYLVYAKHMAAGIKVSSGRYKNARRELNETLNLYKKLGDTEGVLITQADLTMVALREKDFALAEQVGLAAYKQSAEQYTYPRSILSAYLALVYLNLGQLEQAKKYLDERVKYDWFDPRAGLAMLPASYAHAKGEFQQAVDKSAEIKQRLAGQWNDKHQMYADAFTLDLTNNTSSINDYANLHLN